MIVINGGTNDTDKPHIKDTDVLTPMVHFIQKYSNTNIIILDIPYRHDLRKADKTNLYIQSYNSKLKNITKTYQHVSLIEVSSDWRHFTKHGLHLNRYGKEWLAKKITRQIELQIETTAKVNPTITLNGKVEITNLTNGNNLMPTENRVEDNPTIALQQKEEKTDVIKEKVAKDLITGDQTLVKQDNMESTESIHMISTNEHIVEDLIIIDQIPVNQDSMENNESKRRTSTRSKKVPITMSKDFLW